MRYAQCRTDSIVISTGPRAVHVQRQIILLSVRCGSDGCLQREGDSAPQDRELSLPSSR